MDKLYAKLFEEYKEKEKKVLLESAAVFVPMRGAKYDTCKSVGNEDVRLMIVGRAPNGWEGIDSEDATSFGTEAKRLYDNRGRFSWVEEVQKSAGYLLSKSAFWMSSRYIWERLTGRCDEKDWYNNVAWSNLYKISRQEGNPSASMCRAQIHSCREILKQEIKDYNPTHIIFMTDYKCWICDSLTKSEDKKCSFEDILKAKEEGIERNMSIVEAYGKGIEGVDAKFVVTCRPERIGRDSYVNAVIDVFEQI